MASRGQGRERTLSESERRCNRRETPTAARALRWSRVRPKLIRSAPSPAPSSPRSSTCCRWCNRSASSQAFAVPTWTPPSCSLHRPSTSPDAPPCAPIRLASLPLFGLARTAGEEVRERAGADAWRWVFRFVSHGAERGAGRSHRRRPASARLTALVLSLGEDQSLVCGACPIRFRCT